MEVFEVVEVVEVVAICGKLWEVVEGCGSRSR